MNFYGANKNTPDNGLIGVTERGDAGTDFSWAETIKQPCWAGGILITKRMSPRFIDLVMSCGKPLIVHCTCTGNGGTWLEPNANSTEAQLGFLGKLIEAGFPAERTVLRIDPIIPTDELLPNSERVLDLVRDWDIPVGRVRFSLLDQYPHVIQRLRAAGKPNFYPDAGGRYQFHPPLDMKRNAVDMLLRHPFDYSTCAEDWACRMAPEHIASEGCVSRRDLELMGLPVPDEATENPQNRNGCHCMNLKGELLKTRARCPNNCIYCYWKG